MVKPGDTFYDASGIIDGHLWVVISDPSAYPDDKVLIVNLTSWKSDRDQSCTLEAGEHPFIKHKTCVNYRESRLVDTADLDRAVQRGSLKKREQISPALLDRIRKGAARSEFIPLRNHQLLLQQGLIESD